MNLILRFIYRLSLGTWVGTIVLISFVVAPTVFRNLPRQTAGEVMGKVFAGYYSLGIGLGGVALIALVLLALRCGWSKSVVISAALLVVMLASAGHVRYRLMPELLEVRAQIWSAADGVDVVSLRSRLDSLHHQSVRLNGAMLLIGIGLTFMAARRENQLEETVHEA